MSDELKACPFCGRKPRLIKGKRFTSHNNRHHKPGDWIWRPAIRCDRCNFEKVFESLDDTLAWWNKRQPLPLPPKEGV